MKEAKFKSGARVISKAGDYIIPPEFWLTMSDIDMLILAVRDGWLTAEQCARIWEIAGYSGDPPNELEVSISRQDMEREFPIGRKQ